MAVSSVAIQSFQQVSVNSYKSQSVTEQVEQKKNTEQADKANKGHSIEIPTAQERRNATNMAILEANYNVSLSSKNNPNTLTFKSVIDAINKELEPTLGKNAAQKAFDSEIDFTPQATADRIVSFSTAFFPLYQKQHQDQSLEDQLTSFVDLVGGGVDKGFGEAKDILSGLDVFNGDVEKNANDTYDLIFQGYDKFKESVLEAAKKEQEAVA